jgi:O-antigen ligase
LRDPSWQPVTINYFLRTMVLFVGAYNMALPDYLWARPYMVTHGVFLDNMLVVVCVGWMLVSGQARLIASSGFARWCAGLLCTLGLVGVLSTAINSERVADYGQALRHCYYAVWLSLAVHWKFRLHATALLRPFVFGAVVGGLVNLYYTIADPWQTLLGIPTLRSQNGAGGFLAVVTGLAAWLMAVREKRSDAWLAAVALVLCFFATAISYSKTAILICSFGLTAWLALYFRSLLRLRTAWIALGLLMVGGCVALTTKERFSESVTAVKRTIEIKFTNLDITDKYSLGARFQYFFGVKEIVEENPLLGVGYSGFYDAITQTQTYRSGVMVDEDPEAGTQGQSNPHNTFLLYASANGVPGFLLATGIYLSIVFQMIFMYPKDRVLRFIMVCLAGAYFIYGMTLPTLLNTPVMFIAAAMACAGPGRLSEVTRNARIRAALRLSATTR